mgnify:CR=1 FL=1
MVIWAIVNTSEGSEQMKPGNFFQKKPAAEGYDRDTLTPVIRASICTGEKAAGFREKTDGKFREVMLIRSKADLEAFRKRFGIDGEIKTIY